jgi:molybdenum-dependent DNA-binding transcriptional regulator ModE
MLDVRRMKVLREVAVRGSFSAAADALSFTQSAVSQQVAALEREAGAVLVERSARGVRLTEAGEAVVRHADAILARLSEAEAELEAIAGLRGGRLRMAAFESAGGTIVPLAIANFTKRHPAVELSLALARARRRSPGCARASSTCCSPPRAPTSRCRPRRASSSSTCSTTRCTWRSRTTTRSRESATCASPTWPGSRGSRARCAASAPC